MAKSLSGSHSTDRVGGFQLLSRCFRASYLEDPDRARQQCDKLHCHHTPAMASSQSFSLPPSDGDDDNGNAAAATTTSSDSPDVLVGEAVETPLVGNASLSSIRMDVAAMVLGEEEELRLKRKEREERNAIAGQPPTPPSAPNRSASGASEPVPSDHDFNGSVSLSDIRLDAAALVLGEQDELVEKRAERQRQQQQQQQPIQNNTVSVAVGEKSFETNTPKEHNNITTSSTNKDYEGNTSASATKQMTHSGNTGTADSSTPSPPQQQQVRPGAVVVQGIDGSSQLVSVGTIVYNESVVVEDSEEMILEAFSADVVPDNDLEATIMAGMMARAVTAQDVRPIPEESNDEDRSDPSDKKDSKNPRNRIWRFVVLAIVLVVVVVSITIGVLVLNEGRSDTTTASPFVTLAPVSSSFSDTPSSEPTTAMPTVSLEDALFELHQNVSLYPNRGLPPPESAEYQALEWLYNENLDRTPNEQVNLRQRYALSTFAFSVGNVSDPVALERTGWLTSSHECDWDGLFCVGSDQTTVNNLFLSAFRGVVSGTISYEVGSLTALGKCG